MQAGGYAVIFSAELSEDLEGYDEMISRMRELAATQPGFIGMESTMEGAREITVSYWRSADDISSWKRQPEHVKAQQLGRARWYRSYTVRVARIERHYSHGC
jgi:heme-degrading monooxygenase HmoA